MAQPTEQRAARPPREGVLREAPFALRAADDSEPNDGLTLDGYGAVFESITVIDSYEGRFKEKVALGSMRRSFRETPPKVQYDHGRHPLIGSIPIAALRSATEEIDPVLAPKGGAHIIARVFDNWLTAPVRDAIDGKAIDGMSMRMTIVREQWETPDGKVIRDEDQLMAELRRTWYDDVPEDELLLRTLKELKIPEIGPVMWPAYRETSVSVRSVIDLGRLHEPEQRKLLARAVFLADAAEQDDDAQRDAGDKPAVESPPESNDAQRSTTAVGERPSKPRPARDIDLVLRNQRDSLITHKSKGTLR